MRFKTSSRSLLITLTTPLVDFCFLSTGSSSSLSLSVIVTNSLFLLFPFEPRWIAVPSTASASHIPKFQTCRPRDLINFAAILAVLMVNHYRNIADYNVIITVCVHSIPWVLLDSSIGSPSPVTRMWPCPHFLCTIDVM